MSATPSLGTVLAANALHGCTLPSSDAVLAQARRDGAVLCKATGVASADDLAQFLAPLVKGHQMPYFGGTNARTSLSGAGDVLDVGTEPPHIRLREHSEMAYGDTYPGIIVFGCLRPPKNPAKQGQTTLVRTAELMSNLPEALVARLAREGLRHRLRFSDAEEAAAPAPSSQASPAPPAQAPQQKTAAADGAMVRTWQDALSATTRAEADASCAARGWDAEWSSPSPSSTASSAASSAKAASGGGGTLTISYTRPAFVNHPLTGEPGCLFVTDLSTDWYEGWAPHDSLPDVERPYSFTWGGSKSRSGSGALGGVGSGAAWAKENEGALWAAAADRCRYKHVWEAGDVLVVDNVAAMHGRESYEGVRKLGVVLAYPVSRGVD